MFPGANAQVYRNEVGEVIGWDYPSYNDDPYDDNWYQDNYEEKPEFESVEECIAYKYHALDGYGEDGWWVCEYCHTAYAEMEETD